MTTEYAPLRNEDFNSKSLNFDGTGVSGTCTAGQTKNLDYKLPYDCILTGGLLLLKNHAFGDNLDLQIIDKDNVLGYGANTVLKQFLANWGVADDVQIQPIIQAGYPAKPFKDLYLRLVYRSTGSSDVSICLNYLLHKILY